ncbi:hypothetical protein ES705_28126 [subsurface metagenome]
MKELELAKNLLSALHESEDKQALEFLSLLMRGKMTPKNGAERLCRKMIKDNIDVENTDTGLQEFFEKVNNKIKNYIEHILEIVIILENKEEGE